MRGALTLELLRQRVPTVHPPHFATEVARAARGRQTGQMTSDDSQNKGELNARSFRAIMDLLGDELELDPSDDVVALMEAVLNTATSNIAQDGSDVEVEEFSETLAAATDDEIIDIWLDTAAEIVAPEPRSDAEPVTAVLSHDDWVAIAAGLLDGGIGSIVTPQSLRGYVTKHRKIDAADRRKFTAAFNAICTLWRVLGAIDRSSGLTELGSWGIPRSMLMAWDEYASDEDLEAAALELIFQSWREDPDSVDDETFRLAATYAHAEPFDFELASVSEDRVGFIELMYAATIDEPIAAGPAFLGALLSEQLDDISGMQEWLVRAIAADPDHAPSLELAAELAGTAGDAVGARDLLKRAGVPSGDRELATYEAFSRPPSNGPSRNAPCGCGSGRKYKLCCGARVGHPLPDRANWIWTKVAQFAQRPQFRQDMLRWASLLVVGGEDESAAEIVRAAMSDTLVWDAALFDGGILDRFLASRAALLPADERPVVTSWRDTRRSLYEVVASRPGATITFADLVNGGDEIEVRERAGSREVRRGDLVLTRILPVGNISMLGAVRTIPRLQRASLLALLNETAYAEPLLDWICSAMQPPKLQTRDGEELVNINQRWKLDDAGWDELAVILEPRGDDELIETHDLDGEAIIRGKLHRNSGVVTLSTNSAERADRLATLIESAGGSLISDKREAMAETMARPHAVADPIEMTPEVLEVLAGNARRHEQRWIDEEIPMFGGRRPRDMVADPAGRREVEAFLDDIVIQAGDDGIPPGMMDPSRIRSLLGLPPSSRG